MATTKVVLRRVVALLIIGLSPALSGCGLKPKSATPPSSSTVAEPAGEASESKIDAIARVLAQANAEAPAPPPVALKANAPPPPRTTAEMVARLEPSVALIRAGQSHGSGFLVRAGLLATNAHVVSDAAEEDLQIRFPSAPNGQRGPHAARIVALDADRDLALLDVKTDLPGLAIADDYTFRKGEDVLIIGSPGVGDDVVLENTVSRGLLGGQVDLDGQHYYQLSASVNPGNSGGPVFDATGRVIGVVTLRASKQEALAFCVPIDDVRRALVVMDMKGQRAAMATRANPLRYRFPPGESLAYQVEVTVGTQQDQIAWQALSVYRVEGAAGPHPILSHSGTLQLTRPNGNERRTLGDARIELDARGAVVDAEPTVSLPMLGDLAILPFDPLPTSRQTSWEVKRDLMLRSRTTRTVPGGGGEPDRGASAFDPWARFGAGRPFGGGIPRPPTMRPPFGTGDPSFGGRPRPVQPEVREEVQELPAHEVTTYRLASSPDGSEVVKIFRQHEMVTESAPGARPRLRFEGHGEITFDRAEGLPRAIHFDGAVTEVAADGRSERVPIQYRVTRVEATGMGAVLQDRAPLARAPRAAEAPVPRRFEPRRLSERNRPVPPPDPQRRPKRDGRWTILFSGRDAEAWGSAVEGETYAAPLSDAPLNTAFLRLTRRDTGEALIVPVTRDGLQRQITDSTSPALKARWNGTASHEWGATHLGIAEGPMIRGGAPESHGPVFVQTEWTSGFIGSGFGHEGYGDGRTQHFGWHGEKIAPTDFEIAVAPGPLSRSERPLVMGDERAR